MDEDDGGSGSAELKEDEDEDESAGVGPEWNWRSWECGLRAEWVSVEEADDRGEEAVITFREGEPASEAISTRLLLR